MRHKTGRARDHENAVECGGVQAEIAQDRADGAVDIDWKRLLRGSERFFNGQCGLHVRTVYAGFARELEQAGGAWILRMIAVTESWHLFARFLHFAERARGSVVE